MISLFRPTTTEEAIAQSEEILELKYYNDAEAGYVGLQTYFPNEPGLWVGQAYYIFSKKHRYDAALQATEMAIALDDSYAFAWALKGACYIRKGFCNEEVLVSIKKGISLDPELAFAWQFLGEYHQRTENYKESLDSLDRATRLNPRSAYAWTLKGITLKRLTRYIDAVNSLKTAIGLDPKSNWAWHQKGVTLSYLNLYTEAIQAFDQALNIDPTWIRPWREKGLALANLKRYKEAIDCFDNAIELRPSSTLNWLAKAMTLRKLGHYTEALDAVNMSLSNNKHQFESWLEKGIILRDSNRYDESLIANIEAIRIKSKSPLSWAEQGLTLKYLARFEEAQSSFLHALHLANNYSISGWNHIRIWVNFISIFQEKYWDLPNVGRRCWLGLINHIRPLRSAEIILEIINIGVSLKIDSPLIWYSITQQFPHLLTSSKYASDFTRYKEQSEQTLLFEKSLLNQKEEDFERLNILGLMYYHLGNPIKAYEIFDNLDSKDDTYLQVQYYGYLSRLGYGFEEINPEIKDLLIYGVKQSEEILNQSTTSSIQLYYAGLLFRLAEQYSDAETAWKKSSDFLPSNYQCYLLLTEQGRKNDACPILEHILEVENKSLMEQKHCWLEPFTPMNVDLFSEYWSLPFQRYTNYLECYGAIEAVKEDYQNSYKNQKGLEKIGELLKSYKPEEEKLPAYEVWIYTQNSINQLKSIQKNLAHKYRLGIEDTLRQTIGEKIYTDWSQKKGLPLAQCLGNWLNSQEDEKINSRLSTYFLATRYFFHKEQITPALTLTLVIYGHYWGHQRFKVQELQQAYTTTRKITVITLSAGVAASLFSTDTKWASSFEPTVQKMVSVLTTSLFGLFLEQVLRRLETEKGTPIHYEAFQADLIEHLEGLRNKLGDSRFQERFPLQDIEGLF